MSLTNTEIQQIKTAFTDTIELMAIKVAQSETAKLAAELKTEHGALVDDRIQVEAKRLAMEMIHTDVVKKIDDLAKLVEVRGLVGKRLWVIVTTAVVVAVGLATLMSRII